MFFNAVGCNNDQNCAIIPTAVSPPQNHHHSGHSGHLSGQTVHSEQPRQKGPDGPIQHSLQFRYEASEPGVPIGLQRLSMKSISLYHQMDFENRIRVMLVTH